MTKIMFMNGLYFMLNEFNMNVTPSNFDVVSLQLVKLPMKTRYHVGGMAGSAPAFCAAHKHEERLEPEIINC